MSHDKAAERSAWHYERDFEDRETGLMVRINSMTISIGYDGVPDKKRYSYELGMKADGIFTRYFRGTMFSDRGKATMPGRVDGVVLATLITAAEVWMIEQEQARQDALVKVRQKRNQ